MRARILAAALLLTPALATAGEGNEVQQIGHAAKEGARKTGHATREVTRETGHAFRDGAKATGHAFRGARYRVQIRLAGFLKGGETG